MIDHLVFAAPDLEAGSALIEERRGVRPAPGGKHVGGGTHNALLSLGNGAYLEIIAPDPEQAMDGTLARAFDLSSPRIVTWAAKADDIGERAQAAAAAGRSIGTLTSAGRELPDGGTLYWLFTFPPPPEGDGVVPFLIRWAPGLHPSETSRGGCELTSLRGEHPQPERVLGLLQAMNVELPVSHGPAPALIATIRSPNGLVEVR